MNVDVAEYPAPQNVAIAAGTFDTVDDSLKSKSKKKKIVMTILNVRDLFMIG